MTDVKIPDDGGATARMIDVGGYNIPYIPIKNAAKQKQLFDDIPALPLRDDDVMLCTFAKTGTHWGYEVISMMLQKSADRIKTQKITSMIEVTTSGEMNKLPSPRVMNSHLKLRYLPDDLKKKQVKTVLILRNPKDTAVSFYNHMKGIRFYGYGGEWNNWLRPYLRGAYEYGKYSEYLREWHEAIENGTGFPLHVMFYEDLKLNAIEEINKLENFLELDLGDKLKQDIIDACHFDKMLKEKQHPWLMKKIIQKSDFEFYRKGQVGDWENWFTDEQNAVFDEIWTRETEGIKFSFKYTE